MTKDNRMTNIKISVVLSQYRYHQDEYRYTVMKIKNTTDPRVHQSLTKEEVDALISRGIEVTILPVK